MIQLSGSQYTEQEDVVKLHENEIVLLYSVIIIYFTVKKLCMKVGQLHNQIQYMKSSSK
jgi:hypothetical protein